MRFSIKTRRSKRNETFDDRTLDLEKCSSSDRTDRSQDSQRRIGTWRYEERFKILMRAFKILIGKIATLKDCNQSNRCN